MKMQLKKFRIGELADKLAIERFVIRFWEKEFEIKSHRSDGKQRFYDDRDLKKFQRIKQLLYEEGFTIAGAKKQLQNEKQAPFIASQRTELEPETPKNESTQTITALEQQILVLQKKLLKLRELL